MEEGLHNFRYSDSERVPRNSSSDIEVADTKARKKQRQQRFQEQDHELHENDFGNDHTNTILQAPVQSYVVRYAMEIIEKHAIQCRDTLAKSLEENGDVEDSRKVRIQSSQYTQSIIGRVRKRLRETMVPEAYERTEDPCVVNLEQLNQQRTREFDSNYKVIQTLKKQMDNQKAEWKAAKNLRDRERKKMKVELKHTSDDASVLHPLIEAIKEKQREEGKSLTPSSALIPEQGYRKAPKGSMKKLLQQLQLF